MSWWLFLIPLISAIISWSVIRIFFYYLFHPTNPISVAGFKVQGLLPAYQSTIASELGKIVVREFLQTKMIEEKITDPAQVQKIMPVIEEHIDDFLRNKLKKQMPVISVFIGEKTIESLKKVFMTELETLFPKIIGGFASNMVNDLNVESLLAKKINGLSMSEVESAFKKNFSRQITLAQAAAAFIGLFIGLLGLIIIYYVQ
jgi:uncharacterized membrane protein YheB (UPF0754 family)